MRNKGRGRAIELLVLAALVVGWIFLAPAQLGGATIYTATVGDSMEPMFHKGDLALVQPAATYKVGDIVLYQSPVLHRPVLHRILSIQDGHYYFKGDHNHFVDPGYATRADLLGKLWLHVPRAGRVLSWFGVPTHAAALAGVAVAFILLGGGTRQVRRRRGGRRRHAERTAMKTPRTRSMIHRPRKSFENVAGGVGLLLAAVLLFVGFGSSLSRATQVTGYNHTGSFTYSAKVVRPAIEYPTGVVKTGQPLLVNDFKLVKVGFSYRFVSQLPHVVHGTIALTAMVYSDSTLRTHYHLERPTSFNGDVAVMSGTLDLAALRALVARLSVDSGTAATEYTVDFVPVVHVTGFVGGKPVASTFESTIPFTISQSTLKPAAAQALALPGAPPATTTDASVNPAFHPVQAGSIPGVAPNYATFARYHAPISTVRGAGLGLAGLAVIVLLSKLFKAEREIWSSEQRLAVGQGCVIVDVVSVGDTAAPGRESREVPDFASLVTLAQYCERPILRETQGGGRFVYAVEDDGRLYLHRARPRPVAPSPTPAPVTVEPQARPRRSRVALIRLAGGLLLVAVAITAITGFTATTAVPLSHAGTSSQTLAVGQLAPVVCASIAVTRLLALTSGTTATGTASSELILGRNAKSTFNLNGNAGDDCIVGGGGSGTTNKFDGGTGTNICIGAPGAINTFKNCAQTY